MALMRLLLTVLLIAFVASAARAEAPRPPGWTPGAADQRVQDFVDRLKELTAEADRRRAADPLFLNELRKLAGRYDRPWRVEVLYDDFADGNYTANPAWSVAAGRFAIEWGHGLRSVIEPPQAAAAQPSPQTQEVKREDLPGMLLRGFLQQQQQQQQPQQQQQTEAPPDRAEIFIPLRLSNAFALRLELSSRIAKGALEIGVYQGAERATGYTLAYYPGARPGLELLRKTQRGSGIVESHPDALALEDDRTHIVEWTRGTDGAMSVSVDGAEVMTTVDRGFRDPFSGFVFINRGGDYGLHRILISGTD